MAKGRRLCLMALNLYPMAAGMAVDSYGGAELQQLLMARGLMERGHEIVVPSRDHGQRRTVTLDGIHYIGIRPRWRGALKYGHPAHAVMPDTMGLMEAMALADADVYYQRIGEWTTAVTGFHAGSTGRPFIFAAAIDDDLLLQRRPRWLKRSIEYGIERAARVVVQTAFQREIARKRFGIDALLIPSICDIPPGVSNPRANGKRKIVWIGRFNRVKNVEAFLRLVRRFPEHGFVIAGGSSSGPDRVRMVREASEKLPNLEYPGWLPPREAGRLLEGAILVNTSLEEGFPNTFLQAWARGSPVLSLHVDPDGVIEKSGLGIHANGDPWALASGLELLMEDESQASAMGSRGREYVMRNHDREKILDMYESLLDEVLEVAGE